MTNQEKVLKKLRDIGKEMTYVVNCRQGTNEKQYMVAYLVSENELKNGNSCIQQLHRIQTQFRDMVQNGTINLSEKGYIFGRFVFFMNLYDNNTKLSNQHTEKRFFDPNNTLLQAGDHGLFPYGYLVPMLTRLQGDRGSEWTNHRLLIFTYYIPCMHSQHQCAKLIKRYAERTGCKMIIGWITNYKSTDAEESIKEMRSEIINIIKLNDSVTNSASTFPNEQRGGFQRKPMQNFPPQLGAFFNGQYDGYQWKHRPNIPPHMGASWNGQPNGFQPRLWPNIPPHMGASWNGQPNGFHPRLGPNIPPHMGASWNGQQNSFQPRLGPNIAPHMGASWNGEPNGFQPRLGLNISPHMGASWNGQQNVFQQTLGPNIPPHTGASWNGQQNSFQPRLWPNIPPHMGASWNGQQNGFQTSLGQNMPPHIDASFNGQQNGFQPRLELNMPLHMGSSLNGYLSIIAILLSLALSKQTTSIWL